MVINKQLNFVIPVERDSDGVTYYVHSTPISRQVFEDHYLLLSKVFAKIHGEGLNVLAGPRVAALLLRDEAKELGVWDIPGGVQSTLIAEIHRLTNVIVPGPDGWETLPWQTAKAAGKIDDGDAGELENAIVFFIVVSAIHKRRALEATLLAVAGLWSAQTSSLNVTEFQNSLPKLTGTDSSGATAAIPA